MKRETMNLGSSMTAAEWDAFQAHGETDRSICIKIQRHHEQSTSYQSRRKDLDLLVTLQPQFLH